MKFQMLGSADKPGPVRLSDVYNSQVGDASMGIAASQKALYEAYNSLNSSLNTSVTNINNKIANFQAGGMSVLVVKDYPYNTLPGASTDNQVYAKAWWGKIVTDYPNRGLTLLLGSFHPNSEYAMIGYFYGTRSGDLKNSRPQYCSAFYFRYGAAAYFCGYDNGNWFHKTVTVT